MFSERTKSSPLRPRLKCRSTKPAICGTVTLHCVDGDETLRLTMPMPDALLLLNSLRAIEAEFELQGWAEQIGCSAMAMEEVAQELAQFSEDLGRPSASLSLN